MSGSESMVKDLLSKACKSLIPMAVGYLAGKPAGYAAATIIFTTWLLSKRRKKVDPIGTEEAMLIDLSRKIEEQEKKIRLLEKTMKPGDVVAENALRIEREVLERLREEYRLTQLRLLAYRKLIESGDQKLLNEVEKMIDKMKKGKEFTEEQLKILRKLENEWKARMLEESVLLKIIEVG